MLKRVILLKISENGPPPGAKLMTSDTNVKLFCTSTAPAIGERIAQQLGMKLCRTVVEKFSDGELFVKFDESVRGHVIFLIVKIHMPYENFFELLMTVDAARRSSAREV